MERFKEQNLRGFALPDRSSNLPIEYATEFDGKICSSEKYFRIAFLVPLCGSAGIWSPSCIASAQVAVDELNQRSGIAGRQVQLIMIDSALEAPNAVEKIVNTLIETKSIDAIVGMHISAVRQRLSKIVKQRVPYIYTPLFEGGETTSGIYAIGETPELQLGPAMAYLKDRYRVRRWALIGNNYVWPRISHSFAKKKMNDLFGTIVHERYLPFGVKDMRPFVNEIEMSEADAVLISLVGQDAVTFNRAFGNAGLHRSAVRLSCTIEENCLAGIGASGSKRLFSSSSYFGTLRTDANANFRERYYAMHGDCAPLLNTVGQSTYEGVHYLAALMSEFPDQWQKGLSTLVLPSGYKSVRRQFSSGSLGGQLPMYIAEANGLNFDILKEL